jgi:hypothetical protein
MAGVLATPTSEILHYVQNDNKGAECRRSRWFFRFASVGSTGVRIIEGRDWKRSG